MESSPVRFSSARTGNPPPWELRRQTWKYGPPRRDGSQVPATSATAFLASSRNAARVVRPPGRFSVWVWQARSTPVPWAASRHVIDLHAHVLPAIDDGPADVEGSLALLRTAAASRTRIIAATPHLRLVPYARSPQVEKRAAGASARRTRARARHRPPTRTPAALGARPASPRRCGWRARCRPRAPMDGHRSARCDPLREVAPPGSAD